MNMVVITKNYYQIQKTNKHQTAIFPVVQNVHRNIFKAYIGINLSAML